MFLVAESHFLPAESTFLLAEWHFLLAEPHFAREDGSKTALSTQIQHLP
jgi:hypothetical protein